MKKSDSSKLKDTVMQGFYDRLKQGSKKINIHLSDEQTSLMAGHAKELILWNKKINLTAIVDPLAMAEKHFIDAIAVQSFLDQKDLGNGDMDGDFPALKSLLALPFHYSNPVGKFMP